MKDFDNKNILKRQHGIFVSICLVVGFIVGTGIFFLPGRILYEVGGNIRLGILAWIIGGLTISTCVYMFSLLAGKYEKIHGFVDYAETIVGKNYGYLAGWFFAVMYQPAGFAVIAWITSGFTATLAGMESLDAIYLPFRFFISSFFMVMAFTMNYLAPKVPIRFNVGTTLARMIPLVFMGTMGVIVGLVTKSSNQLVVVTPNLIHGESSLFAAISATAFGFNGWQAALAFNSEIKDSKKNFPLAIMTGFSIVIVVYVLYFIGVVVSSPDNGALMMQGGGENFAKATHNSFVNVFGMQAGSILTGFMIISGLGILNACCLGMSRAMYSLGRRNMGPMPHRMAQLDITTNVPNNSMVVAVGISFIWLFVIFANTNWFQLWFGDFRFNLPDFYNFSFFALLIPIFICYIKKSNDSNWFKRFVAPIMAILGAGFMFATYWIGSFINGIVYAGTFVFLALIGFSFVLKKNRPNAINLPKS